MTQEGPRFNLKAVVQQTGLKPDTLRAWERRYGLPAPERSAGGHRLYSRRDIDTLKWLTARQREGLSIKRAVALWRQIEAQGRDPLQAAAPLASPRTPGPAPRRAGVTLTDLRQQWAKACLAYDEGKAEQLLNEAFALYSPETVAIEVLQQAMAEIGEGWYRGEVTVQQEHFCSALAVRRLEALVMAAPPPIRPGRILAACPPQEQHVIGLLLLTLLLRRRGWEVIYLGANVPIAQLESTIEVIQPHLVIMSAQLLHTAASLKQAAHVLEQMDVPLAYGGLIFNLVPALSQRIPGHFLGEQIEAAPLVVESLMSTRPPLPARKPVPDDYRQALEHYQARQDLIEAHVVEAMNAQGHSYNHLAMANRELGLNLGAALALGDMAYLGNGIEWVAELLANYDLPQEVLYAYLRAYRQSLEGQLDSRGQPILTWFGQVLDGKAGE